MPKFAQMNTHGLPPAHSEYDENDRLDSDDGETEELDELSEKLELLLTGDPLGSDDTELLLDDELLLDIGGSRKNTGTTDAV